LSAQGGLRGLSFWGLEVESQSPPSLYLKVFTMAKERSFGIDKSWATLRRQLNEICDFLGVKDLHNVLPKLQGDATERDKLREEPERLKQEICALVGTKDYTAAKKRIVATFKKLGLGESAALKYNLDTSFLQGVGARWERKAEGKTELQVVENLTRNITRQRNKVTEYYYKYLDQVMVLCEKEGLGENETREEIERWHSALKDDFDLLTPLEFVDKYYDEFYDLSVLPKEPTTVLLIEAFPFVKNIAPQSIYQELLDYGEQLGYVSRHTFAQWENTAVSVKTMRHTEALASLSELQVKIIGTAVNRVIQGPESFPNFTNETNTLTMLLTDPEVNPYGCEFEVTDKTSLLELLTQYATYANLKLPS
jgi:hypothetical protein